MQNHIVYGAESYLQPILEPLLRKYDDLLDSQKSFQARSSVKKEKFIEREHDLVTYDKYHP